MEAGRGAFWEFVRSDLPALLERYPTEAVFPKAPSPAIVRLLKTLDVRVRVDRRQRDPVRVARAA